MEKTLTWQQFEQVDMRVGTILKVEEFPKARNPAFILHIDFGEAIGVLKSSAQITDFYQPESLIGKQVIAVVNFPSKQIGPVRSQCLVTGFHHGDQGVVLATPDLPVPNGSKLA